MKRNMEWNVYREDFNARDIEIFNVFKHGRFNDNVLKLLKENLSYDEFSEKLKSEAMYYFWSKCEYEVIITSFPTFVTKEEVQRLSSEDVKYRAYVNLEVGEKIDIYGQLRLNWDRFVDYVWSFRKVKL